MKLKFYQSLFLIAALGFAFNQTAAAQAVDERQILNAADVPMEGAAIEDFAPKNWKITSRASGDLNGDRLADWVLIVAANDFDSALIVIFKRASGGFTRAAVAPNARRCDCGSVLGDGTPAIKIERGQIVFFGSSGSREAQEKRMRFRWEAAARRFLLIGDDLETIDRAVGDTQTISSNYLTNLQIITEIAPRKRDRKRTRKIPAQRIYLDELDYQNYWEQFEEQRENL